MTIWANAGSLKIFVWFVTVVVIKYVLKGVAEFGTLLFICACRFLFLSSGHWPTHDIRPDLGSCVGA